MLRGVITKPSGIIIGQLLHVDLHHMQVLMAFAAFLGRIGIRMPWIRSTKCPRSLNALARLWGLKVVLAACLAAVTHRFET